MGILSRFGDIMSANINALLDKCEDPSKMIDQYLRDAKEDFAKVKQETAAVMAEETRTKRLLDDAQKRVDDYATAARNAVAAGNDVDARKLLAKKADAGATRDTALTTYQAAHANANKMKQLHNKLAQDIQSLEARRNNVKAQMSVAKTQETVNKITKGTAPGSKAAEGFSRMEQEAQRRLDQATAEAELAEMGGDDDAELLEKYKGTGSADVDAELAKLKAELGKE